MPKYFNFFQRPNLVMTISAFPIFKDSDRPGSRPSFRYRSKSCQPAFLAAVSA
jgi:hypothetical protein